jgi:hypothetical protein
MYPGHLVTATFVLYAGMSTIHLCVSNEKINMPGESERREDETSAAFPCKNRGKPCQPQLAPQSITEMFVIKIEAR